MQAFLLLIVGIASGPIFDAGYFQALIWSGSFLVVFGMMMTSIATQYWQLMLAQGLCVGIGSGFLFIPSVAIVTTYFSTKKAFATGIAAAGSSFGEFPPSIDIDTFFSTIPGGVILPIVFFKLQPQIGFGWATRVVAFVMLVTLSVPLAVMKTRLPPVKKAFFDPAAFKEPPFTLFSFGLFFGFMGLYIPFFYISSYAAENHITNPNIAFWLLVILNASSFFGRIVPNFVADKTGPLNMLIPCSLIASILAFAWIGIKSTAGLVVFAILYGFFSGTFVSLPAPAVASISPSMGVVGTRMGMSFTFAGFGLLIGNPVAGTILGSNHWVGLQAFSGATTALATLTMAFSRIATAGVSPRVKA